MSAGLPGMPAGIMGVEEARALARDRFRDRLQAGEPVGGCACHDEAANRVVGAEHGGPAETVAGVRFRDSGRTYYFRTGYEDLAVGDWVVAETGRGREAGRVAIAPHQVARKAFQGELTPILRRLTPEDVERMEGFRGKAAEAVRTCGTLARARRLPVKVIAADYAFDGGAVAVSYSVPERERAPEAALMRDFVREAASALGCRVDLRQVGPRDEARLLGGLGRCGRTLCCSSWLPVFPEISMNMAKTQDLPLNPSKVSGVCGRLLCCLSYENEQYKQMKALMPRLGQTVQTANGPGLVVAMQLMRELVTVRLEQGSAEVTLPVAEVGPGPRPQPAVSAVTATEPTIPAGVPPIPEAGVARPEPRPAFASGVAGPGAPVAVPIAAAAAAHAAMSSPLDLADASAGVAGDGEAPAAQEGSAGAGTGARRRRRRRGSGQAAP